MQLKATCAKQSLVNSLDLSLSRQHYALYMCVGTLKFQPTMVLQSCFCCSQIKMVLSGIAGPGFLLFLPIWMGNYAHRSAKDTYTRGSLFSNFFTMKTSVLFLWQLYDNYFRVADMIWIFFSLFCLIGDIPLSPGDIPRDFKICALEDPLFIYLYIFYDCNLFSSHQHFYFQMASTNCSSSAILFVRFKNDAWHPHVCRCFLHFRIFSLLLEK